MNAIYCLILISHLGFGIENENDKIDEIIAHHKNAIGYSALAEIQSIILIGERETYLKLYDTCYTNYYKEIRKRPELFYYESEFLGHKVYEGFDGKNHWSRSRIYDNDFFDISRYKANLDGLVYLYDKGWIRGFKIISKEKAEVFELDIYTEHKQQIYIRLNPKTYLITSILFENFDDNKRYTSEYLFSKYRKVKKIKIPFNEEFIYNGDPYSVTKYNKVLIDKPVENEIFKRLSHVKE